MLLPSGSLLVALMLLKYSDDLLSDNLQDLSNQKVEKFYNEMGFQVTNQGREVSQFSRDGYVVTAKPVTKKTKKKKLKIKKKKTKEKLMTRNNNGDEKFWGGTEVVLSPEEAGKVPFADGKKPNHHYEEVDSFHKFVTPMLPIISFAIVKILILYPMKIAGLFLFVATSGFVGLIAFLTSAGLYIFSKE